MRNESRKSRVARIMWPRERERDVHKADRKIERERESRSRSLNVPRKTQRTEELTVEEYERAQCGKMRF